MLFRSTRKCISSRKLEEEKNRLKVHKTKLLSLYSILFDAFSQCWSRLQWQQIENKWKTNCSSAKLYMFGFDFQFSFAKLFAHFVLISIESMPSHDTKRIPKASSNQRKRKIGNQFPKRLFNPVVIIVSFFVLSHLGCRCFYRILFIIASLLSNVYYFLLFVRNRELLIFISLSSSRGIKTTKCSIWSIQ